jgi:acyl-CoA synthetase (AMP-forming)/AMP-acid ligase II
MPDGWLATSDLGRLDPEGNLTIVGRADDAYIRGGYNIYPSEVEAALAAHPRVARVAVVGALAPVIGEIGVAFVVTDRTDGAVTATELQDWCRDRIADYKVPDAVVFLADLPVNATYKVDTGRLREMAAALGSATRRLPAEPARGRGTSAASGPAAAETLLAYPKRSCIKYVNLAMVNEQQADSTAHARKREQR